MRFVPLAARHLPLLHRWMGQAHWLRWWGPQPTLAELRAHYGPRIDGRDRTRCFIVEDEAQGGVPIGFIQLYTPMGEGGGWWEDETDPGARGIDQSLADAASLGRGIGRRLIHAFVSKVFREDPGVTLIQTDPAPANERAIRCCRAVGFEDHGLVTTPDGAARLMKLGRDRWRTHRLPARPSP